MIFALANPWQMLARVHLRILANPCESLRNHELRKLAKACETLRNHICEFARKLAKACEIILAKACETLVLYVIHMESKLGRLHCSLRVIPFDSPVQCLHSDPQLLRGGPRITVGYGDPARGQARKL